MGKSRTRSVLAVAVLALLVGVFVPVSIATADEGNPQLPKGPAIAAAAPDQCLLFNQQTPDEHHVRKTYNTYNYYNGAGWQNVLCGGGSFKVPRGQQALVDLSATAELDCTSPEATGWCEGRFLVNGLTNSVHPSNEGRSDSYAWDAGKSGQYDWSAHPLDQEYAVRCPESSTTTADCSFKFQLQVQLTAGASYLWLDDLTVRVDAYYGKLAVTAVTP